MALEPVRVRETLRFGEDFELEVRTLELRRAGHSLKLERIPVELLLVLVKQRGQLVTREQIIESIWGKGVFLDTDNSINGAIRKIRHVLKDDPEHPHFVQTITGRGYRFIAPVIESSAQEQPASPSIQGPALASALAKVAEMPVARDAPLARDDAAVRARVEKPVLRLWMLFAAIAIVSSAVLAGYLPWFRLRNHSQPLSGRLMLAVLPFENLTGDAGQEYFSDGLTEEMITQLGNLDPQHLGVIARTSVMHYKNSQTQLEQIGRELGVQYVLEGSVRRDADKVRISAQLIQVKDQTHLWAKQYDRELSSVLILQGQIAQETVDEIQLTFGEGNKRTGSARQAISSRQVHPEAYEHYLRGLYFQNRYTPEDWHRAVEAYQEALALDPTYAPTHAQLAQIYQMTAGYGQGPASEFIPKSEAEAREGMREDPRLADPHFELAYDLAAYEWKWTAAEKEFQLGFALNPDSSRGHSLYAFYLVSIGHSEEAIAEQTRARELDPLSPIVNSSLAEILFMSRNYDQTIEQCTRNLAMFPDVAEMHDLLARAYAKKGMLAEAAAETQASESRPEAARAIARAFSAGGYPAVLRWELQDLQRKSRNQYVSPIVFAFFYAMLNDHNKALEWLERDYAEHDVSLFNMNAVPEFDSLHTEPRYQDLMRRIGLPH